MGNPSYVSAACLKLKELIGPHPSSSHLEQLDSLMPLVHKRVGPIVIPLFNFFEELSIKVKNPWPLLESMLSAGNEELIARALARIKSLVKSGTIAVTMAMAEFFAGQVMNKEDSLFLKPKYLSTIAFLLGRLDLPDACLEENAILYFYQNEKEMSLRQLAARILDIDGTLPDPDLVEQIFGKDVYDFLCPYLDFTRATHLDLLYLIPVSGQRSPVVKSLRKLEKICDKLLLKNVIAELGWPAINFGLEVEKYVGMSFNESFPFMLSPSEASLFMDIQDASRLNQSFMFIAHGGLPAEKHEEGREDTVISRFRSLNIAHSEALSFFLTVAPLTRGNIDKLLELMDDIVSDFMILFSSYADECAILPDVYEKLRHQILAMLEKEESEIHFSTELIRLIQVFEGPKSLGEVRTLHGLKRYLHQRGLSLGFHLLKTSHFTNRTVSIMKASSDKTFHISRCIQYIDFGQKDKISNVIHVPYPVMLVINSFGRQLIHGKENLPDIRIFCYNNEVHYYITFKGHPAFLRIDYSPPERGGMIDLEYYGVSKHELDHHPNLSLDALKQFFRDLGFEIQVNDTRVHIRYDKEKTLDLGDLCEKAQILFRLMPYLMELDWILEDLDLDGPARQKVRDAWFDYFKLWGVLPLNQLLGSDRRGVLMDMELGPTGEREINWSGAGPYQDRFVPQDTRDLFNKLQSAFSKIGMEINTPFEVYEIPFLGQIHLEKYLLFPLRRAVFYGEISENPEGFRKTGIEYFKRQNEVELFAKILASEDNGVCNAATLAELIKPLEQTLCFETSGILNGYEVQKAPLSLLGKTINIFVLRDRENNITMGMFARDEVLYKRRMSLDSPWQSNASIDPYEFAEILSRSNYTTLDQKNITGKKCFDEKAIIEYFRKENPAPLLRSLPGEKILKGIVISPGRTAGTVIFGTKGRMPKDFDGSILVAQTIHPDDNTYFYHTSGIVSTGGSILSHAGLIAMQFRKPAIIVNGRWQKQSNNEQVLLFYSEEYSEDITEINGFKITVRQNIQYREHALREGDLVVIDAETGFLRVLGQSREALVLHENFTNFGKVSWHIFNTSDKKRLFELRGRRLRILYQSKKLLSQLHDPVLACHAVHELLFSEHMTGMAKNITEKAKLLSCVLNNNAVAKICHEYLFVVLKELEYRYRSLCEKIRKKVPLSPYFSEILTLRLRAIHLRQWFNDVTESLSAADFDTSLLKVSIPDGKDIDKIVLKQLEFLQMELIKKIESINNQQEKNIFLRHYVRQLERVNKVLADKEKDGKILQQIKALIKKDDKNSLIKFRDRRILWPDEAGYEFSTIAGWKAANLAEIERLGGGGLVPPWFVITDYAFQEVMNLPLETKANYNHASQGHACLKDGIQLILNRNDINNSEKSQQIRKLWEDVRLPSDLVKEVVSAYHRLADVTIPGAESEMRHKKVFVAVRSSAKEEDTEDDVGAGEFDTFLYISGEDFLLEHIKLAWGGLWTERAIHNRSILIRDSLGIGGGIIIQKNIFPRVSGVLQTVNASQYEMQEMIINAGLGVGEGIVSGDVGADHFVVSKETDLDGIKLRYRPVINEKLEKVVFNEKEGVGTIRSEVSYYQRLRPALEYVEIYELTKIAHRFEKIYGYPLDIEFCIEGSKIWILQVRPVPTFFSVLRANCSYPINR